MGKRAAHPYLKRRGNVWWIKVAVPRALRHLYSSPHVEQSLQTESVTEAERTKLARVALIHLDFRRKRREQAGNLPAHLREAFEYRAQLAQARDGTDAEILSGLVTDRAGEISEASGGTDEHASEHAKNFAAIAFLGQDSKTLREAFDAWITTADFRAGTQTKYRRAFDEFMAFLGHVDTVPAKLTPERIRSYVDFLNAGSLDPATKRGRVIALSAFWKNLQRDQQVPIGPNPWRGHTFTGARAKAATLPKERPYKPEELLALINGPERGERSRYTKRTMIELTALGIYTGARLEEICARKLADVEPIRGGYMLHIREAKSRAGARSIPILHPIPASVLKQRIGKRRDPAAFLFAEFAPGGPDGKRSWQVQKALGHYRRAVGLPEGVDFHSTRRTFATVMEKLGVDLRWVERYFGHKPAGLIGRTYAQGSPESLRKVAQQVKYPAKVERAFKVALML
jgi:integrase